MRAVLKARRFVFADQSQPRLMHESRRLKRLARRFVRHLARGQLAQFLIHQRNQFPGGFRVALLDGVQDSCHFAHAETSPNFLRMHWDHELQQVRRHPQDAGSTLMFMGRRMPEAENKLQPKRGDSKREHFAWLGRNFT